MINSISTDLYSINETRTGGWEMKARIACLLCLLLAFSLGTLAIASGVDDNTAGLWLLDEGAGIDVMDMTANGNNGQIQGDASWVDGVFGTGLDFSASASVIVPNSASLMLTSQITVEAWVNFSDAGVAQDMVIARIEPGFSLQKFNNDTMEGWVNIGGWKGVRDVPDGQVLQPNEWYHVAFTYDGTMMKIYVNGELDREIEIGGDIEIAEEPFTIGSYKGEAYYWLGMVDEVRISNVARTQDEIKASMGGLGMDPSSVAPVGKLVSTWASIKK